MEHRLVSPQHKEPAMLRVTRQHHLTQSRWLHVQHGPILGKRHGKTPPFERGNLPRGQILYHVRAVVTNSTDELVDILHNNQPGWTQAKLALAQA